MRLARPAQEPVGIVLDDHHVMTGGQLQHAPAPLERHRRATRVLEVRDHVQERRCLALELGRERIGVDAVAVDRDADDLGARALQDQDAAVVGRGLDEHPPGRGAGEQDAGHERERLERAVGADDALGRHAVALADPAAQPGMAARGVGERDRRLPLHGVGERAPEVVDGQHVGARDATRERNRIGHGRQPRPGRRATRRRPAGARRTRPHAAPGRRGWPRARSR